MAPHSVPHTVTAISNQFTRYRCSDSAQLNALQTQFNIFLPVRRACSSQEVYTLQQTLVVASRNPCTADKPHNNVKFCATAD